MFTIIIPPVTALLDSACAAVSISKRDKIQPETKQINTELKYFLAST